MLMMTMVFFAGCSQMDSEETVTPRVWAEEIQLPVIENKYETSAGIKADYGNYYEIQDGMLKGYGENQYGQLGIGTIEDLSIRYETPRRDCRKCCTCRYVGRGICYLFE